MPRDSNDVYFKPAGTTAVSGQVISSEDYNTLMDDFVADLNLDRPVAAGGTGASNKYDARSSLQIGAAFATKALAEAESIHTNETAVWLMGWLSKGDGAGGLFLRVAAEPAHAAKFSSNGGTVWWEKVDLDGIGPDHVGATNGANPTGREAFAPALVTALSQYKREGVTLRKLLGSAYNGTSDVSVALNGFTAELAPAGIAITDPDGIEMRAEASLYIRENLKLHFGPHTTIKKVGTFAGLLKNPDWATEVDVNGFEIEGGHWTTNSSADTGHLFMLFGNNWRLSHMRVTEFYHAPGGGCAFIVGGDNIAMHDIYAKTAATSAGTGTYRIIGGRGGRFTHLFGEGGDDVFQFVPGTVVGNPYSDRSIEDMFFVNCHGFSKGGRLLVAAIGGGNQGAVNSGVMRNVGWIGCTGKANQRGLVIMNDEADGSQAHQVGWIYATNCTIDVSGQTAGQQSQTLYVGGSSNGGNLGPVYLDKLRVIGNNYAFGLEAERISDLTLRDCEISGETSALVAGQQTGDNVGRLTVSGGYYRIVNNGGGGTPTHAIQLGLAAEVSRADFTGVTIENVPSSRDGIFAHANAKMVTIRAMEVNKASGATSTDGIGHETGATVRLADPIDGTRDTEASGTGTLTRATYA